jgi:hypothetical protein
LLAMSGRWPSGCWRATALSRASHIEEDKNVVLRKK